MNLSSCHAVFFTVSTQLLKDLEKLMYPSKVNVKCPLEMSEQGKVSMVKY